MSIALTLAVLVIGVALVGIAAFARGYVEGQRGALLRVREEANERRRRTFALACHKGSELNHARHLLACDELDRVDAELDGDAREAKYLHERNDLMEDHLLRLEAVCN